MLTTVANETLEQFLTQCGLRWQIIPSARHVSLSDEWETLYGNGVSRSTKYKEGVRAQYEYSHQSAEVFMIVPFLGNQGGPHSITKRGPRNSAYNCVGDGKLPDLASFANLDFFIVPADLGWTMIHTHEDYEWGGPYFILKDWLEPSRIPISSCPTPR